MNTPGCLKKLDRAIVSLIQPLRLEEKGSGESSYLVRSSCLCSLIFVGVVVMAEIVLYPPSPFKER